MAKTISKFCILFLSNRSWGPNKTIYKWYRLFLFLIELFIDGWLSYVQYYTYPGIA